MSHLVFYMKYFLCDNILFNISHILVSKLSTTGNMAKIYFRILLCLMVLGYQRIQGLLNNQMCFIHDIFLFMSLVCSSHIKSLQLTGRSCEIRVTYQDWYIIKAADTQGLYSLRGRTSYRQILWRREAVSSGFRLFQSLCNLTGTSAATLPRCLSTFRAMWSL